MGIRLLKFISLIAATACKVSRYEPYDYCDPNLNLCDESSSHTMCRYPRSGLSKNCMPDINEPLAAPEKFHALYLHNKLRSKVASGQEKINHETMPHASNMFELRWDEELEAIATRWAEQCVNVTARNIHDECRNTKRFTVSQNVATLDVKDQVAERRMQNFLHKWHVKSKYFDPKTLDSFMSVEDHHLVEEYSNMIWAETYAIGCARIIFRGEFSAAPSPDAGTDGLDRSKTFERLICNYAPSGNIPNRPIYKRGIPCSECPKGTICSPHFPGLCSFSEKVTASSVTDENARLTAKMVDETFAVSTTQNIILKETISSAWTPFVTPAEELTEAVTVTEQTSEVDAVEKGVKNRNETVKILVKAGIFYNGKCHCSDIVRSGNKKKEGKGDGKISMHQEQFFKRLLIARKEMEAEGYRREMSLLKHGDKCQCIRFLSGGFNRIVLSELLYYVPIIHGIRLLMHYLQTNFKSSFF